MNKQTIENLFRKCCVNQCRAIDSNGETVLYKRQDLCNLSMDAAEKGQKYFYIKKIPIPNEPKWFDIELGEPEYRYFLQSRDGLSEEEYQKLLDECE